MFLSSPWRALGEVLCFFCIAVLLGSCSPAPETTLAQPMTIPPVPAVPTSFEEARQVNLAHHADPRFGDRPQIIAEEGGAGTTQLLFDTAPRVILAAEEPTARLRAASLAIALNVPVLSAASPATSGEELRRLGVDTILLVGHPVLALPEGIQVVRDSGTPEALSALTSVDFHSEEIDPTQVARRLASLSSTEATILQDAAPEPSHHEPVPAGAFPAQAPRSGTTIPIVAATDTSDVLDIANARVAGAEIRVLDNPDPRFNEATTWQLAGMAEQPLIALGAAFGTAAQLSSAIALADAQTVAHVPELPGGGRLLFPGRRMVALYGHPSGGALGVLGETSPEAAVAYVADLVAQYLAENPAEPVIPAFEIIATVASSEPGPDGDYSNESDPAELIPYLDAITQAGGYAVLDLQPGQSSFLDQARRYEDLLIRPNVGLALDPEWHIRSEERPLERVGSATAAEVNEVATWLAELTSRHNLPQKAFVLHQFQVQMLRDREHIDTSHLELAYVLHIDGHGTPAEKTDTWEVIRAGLDPRFFLAWKNFLDEDQPMYTPAQTMAISPRPWFVSYQ